MTFKDSSRPGKTYATAMWAIVGINIVLCFFLIGLIVLIPIGAWQVLDAIARVLQGDQRRKKYLLVVVLYFLIMGLSTFSQSNIDTVMGVGYLFVVSNIIALWYCYITHAHANEVTAPPAQDKALADDILDADLF
jgi:hypothetical protein